MCNPASFVLTKDRVHWSKASDSHENIITEYSLHADGARGPNIVRVEVTPPEVDGVPQFAAPLEQWVYRVDQDSTPPWYDAADGEKRAREALVEWAAFHVHVAGEARVYCGTHYASGSASVRASGSASVRASGSASVVAYGSASVVASGSASVRASGSASVEAYDSASVRAYGSAVTRFYSAVKVSIAGSLCVAIDMRGDAAVCHVGDTTVRMIETL